MRSTSDELKSIFGLIYNENEHERNAAASALYRAMLRLGLHPSDIYIGPSDAVFGEQIEAYHRKRLNEMMRENDFFRRHTDPALIRQAASVGDIEYRWYELELLIRDKLTGDPDNGGPLSRGWQAKLKDCLGISQTQLNRWQQGIDLIPERAFAILNEMPSIPEILALTSNDKPKRVRKVVPQEITEPDAPVLKAKYAGRGDRSNYYDWSQPGVFDIVKSGFLVGSSVKDIAENINSAGFAPIDTNRVLQAAYNSAPKVPQDVFSPESDKPISWPEAWQIGGSMWGKSWTRYVMVALELPIDTKPPTALKVSPDKVRSLRHKYKDWLVVKEKDRLAKLERENKAMMTRPSQKTKFLDVIVEAGPRGMTVREATDKLGWTGHHVQGNHGRVGDLVRQFLIFRVGEQPGRDGDVFVSTKFGEHYPKEFTIAKAAFKESRIEENQ